MINQETEFTLPIGLKDSKGFYHRKGSMRTVTAQDELDLQEMDSVRFNDRQRDLELLARLITTLGQLPTVGSEELENLYEADFIYLQMLFNSLNNNTGEQVTYQCPQCGSRQELHIPTLFVDEKGGEQKEEISFRLPHGSGLTPEMGSKVRGTMAMARCSDFITLYRDARTRENPSWFYVGLLTRCVKKLATEKSINNSVITKLSPQDFSFLVDLFNELNNSTIGKIKNKCQCGQDNTVELQLPGEV